MKILYVDVETTGTDPRRHGLIQYAQIIEVDGRVECEEVFNLRPFPTDEIEDKALEVTGTRREDLFVPPRLVPMEAWFHIRQSWDRFVNKYDPGDKFTLAGYNVDSFDQQFIREFVRKCAPSERFSVAGSYIGHETLDPLPVLKWLKALGRLDVPKLKLQTICDLLAIPLEQAHDALADIRATRELVRRVRRVFSSNQPFSLGALRVEVSALPMFDEMPGPTLTVSDIEKDLHMGKAFEQITDKLCGATPAPVDDALRDAAIQQGYVPTGCTLAGEVIMGLMNIGKDPCRGCNANREVCHGRPGSNEPEGATI